MKRIIAILLALMLMSSCALAEVGLTSFKTYDISSGTENMKMVSQDIFAGYDLTMVNIWATWCGYCVQEMPELAKLKDMLPENVNLITICDDAASETALAQEILKLTGATNFATLMASEEMYSQLLSQVYAFPTTYFLDSEGMPVGQPITGVPSLTDAADAYYAIIQDVLSTMEG